MADKPESGPTPPYVSYKTFKTLLRMIAPAMPSRIDKDVMPTFSGANQTQVIQALKYLRLVDELGVPTEKLYALVLTLDNQETFQEAMFDVLDVAYPFADSFDHTTATDGQLNEAFAKLAQGDTIRKCKSFYLAALKDAGATLSPYIKEPGKRGPSAGKKRGLPAKNSKGTKGKESQTQQNPPPPSLSGVHPALAGILKELPTAGSAWPKANKDRFMGAFKATIDFIYPEADDSEETL